MQPGGFRWAVLGLIGLTACAVGAPELPDGSIDIPSRDGGRDAKVSFPDSFFPQLDVFVADGGVDADATIDGAVGDGSTTSDAEADSGKDGGAPKDSGLPKDAATHHDAGCPVGMTGPGCTECATGYHLCGATCTATGANNPSTGCSQGCGTACPATGGEVASCTAAGACTAGCPTGEMMCSGGCAACCTDTDCPANVLCASGTCSECATGYGTCATMCDTNLTTDDNCGFCGNSCDTSLFGCGFFDPCSCQGSGAAQNWSCQG